MVDRDQFLEREVAGLLSVTSRLPVESQTGGFGHLRQRHVIRDRPDTDQIAEPRSDPPEHHERLVTALFDRAERPDRARQVLAERLVAQIPGLLLAETPELTMDLRRTDPLGREGVRELLDGSYELRRERPDRFHQCPSRGRRQVQAGSAGTLEEPRLDVLPLKLDLRDG